MKSSRNEENDNNPKTIDTSHNDKYHTSHTNQDGFIEYMEDMKNNNDEDK